jgi:ADP-ribosylglycohydrolase
LEVDSVNEGRSTDTACRLDRIAGVILGTAVGDALGVPREGISRRRAQRLFGGPPLHHQFFFGRGMISDDTEHTCLVGQALVRAPDDPAGFARSLAWGLRLWLLGLPAGIGRATLRSILKLWLGFPLTRSGVWSAGNGPAMRAALLGVCLGQDIEKLRPYIRASTRITHTDPRAETGALLVALAAHHGAERGADHVDGLAFLQEVRNQVELDAELSGILDQMEDHLRRNAPAVELADALGLRAGVSGYIYHTVPIALYCWLRSPADFRAVVEDVICLGGDADTTGAIVGGIAGATVGFNGIPAEWIAGLWEWPCSVAWMRRLAERLAQEFPAQGVGKGEGPVRFFWPGVLPRNLLFLLIVLGHVGRRLLPPYSRRVGGADSDRLRSHCSSSSGSPSRLSELPETTRTSLRAFTSAIRPCPFKATVAITGIAPSSSRGTVVTKAGQNNSILPISSMMKASTASEAFSSSARTSDSSPATSTP